MEDEAFPRAWLSPLTGSISGTPEDVAIAVPLAPFELDGTILNTSIVLDGFELSVPAFAALVGRSFSFPVNPELGYIDGSVYVRHVRHVHNPVDVTVLSFGAIEGNIIEAQLKGTIVFTFEGSGFADLPFYLKVFLQINSGGPT